MELYVMTLLRQKKKKATQIFLSRGVVKNLKIGTF